jgi:hypothetical protein
VCIFCLLLPAHYYGLFLQVKSGFGMVGHTHEEVDQMFSRLSMGLRQQDTRSVTDLYTIIGKSYTPNPLVQSVEDTMDFDQYKHSIGYGVLGGIQGEVDAAQEEKPHQIKVILVEGRATLYWRALAKNQRKKIIAGTKAEMDHAWQPAEGIDILRQFDWPDHLTTKTVAPISQDLLDKLVITQEAVLKRHELDTDIEDVKDSWIRMLEWIADPPRSANSKTWLEFQNVFNIIPSHIRKTRDPTVNLTRISKLTLTELDEERENMAGVGAPEADIAGELAATKAGAAKKNAALNGDVTIEVAQHPQDAMGHGSRKKRVRELELTIKGYYIGITTTTPNWCCFRLLERLPEDKLKVWWFGNRTVDHRGSLWALRDRNEGTKNTIQVIKLKTVAAINIKWNAKNTLSEATRRQAEEAAATYILSRSKRKEKDTLCLPTR